VTFVVAPWSNDHNTDVTHFPPRADEWVHGKLPYRDVDFEYPPLAVPLIGLPALVKVGSYKLGFGLIALAFGLALVALCAEAARLSGGDGRRAAFAMALTPFLAGALVRGYFDLAPMAITLAALVALLRRRTRLGFGLLGLAVMTKGFPLVVAPVALAWLLGRGRRRDALEGLAVMAAVIAVLGVAVLAISPKGAWYSIHYQIARPVEIESSPASLLYAWDWIAGRQGQIVGSYGSVNLEHPGGRALGIAFGVLLVAVVALLSYRAARLHDQRTLLVASLGAVAAFAAFGKVFSPQYVIWLLPLTALAVGWGDWAIAGLGAAATLLTRIEFPTNFGDLADRRIGIVLTVMERNLAVVVLVTLSAGVAGWKGRWYHRKGPSSRDPRSRSEAASVVREAAGDPPQPPSRR
jgi:Glycosyltransferase family 87